MAAPKTSRRGPDAASGRRIAAEGTDHWAFLEEIEAPMWVDLKVEGQRVSEDHSDDAWFHTTHLVHQLPSRRLKPSIPHCATQEKPERQEILCRSPNLPDSVSQSRGKHYSAKKWSSAELHTSSSEHHPIRKLGGKGSKISPRWEHDLAKSRSAITPLEKSRSKSGKGSPAAADGAAIIRNPSSNPRPRISIPPASSALKPSSTSAPENMELASAARLSVAAGRMARVLLGVGPKGKPEPASRSGLASSASLEQKLDKIIKIRKDGSTDALNPGSGRGGDDECSRTACQEQNLKALHSDRLRKPLSRLNVVGPVKKVVSSCEKKNGGVGRTASNAGSSDRSGVKSLKSSRSCREGMPGRDGVPNAEKGKTHGAKRAAAAAAPRRITSAKHLR